MQTLTDHVLHAFLTHWPRLCDDPLELAARLQRRRRALLTRPPRAWCIALRASDTRMSPWNTTFDDCHAPARRRPHTVTLTAALIRRLCRAVYVQPPGESWTDVAARLGVNPPSLRRQMKNGFFQVRRILHLGGKRGRPVPVLYRDGPLDPCSRGFRPPDPHWGDAWQWHYRLVPPDLEQAVYREPVIAPPPLNFRCWVWQCPACHQRADVLYYPLPMLPPEILLELNLHLHEADAPPQPVPTFACQRCHRIAFNARIGDDGWNDFVTYVTAGLLYGREVPIPPDWPRSHRTYRPLRRNHPHRGRLC